MWFVGQGLYKGVLAYPPYLASYVVSVRQLQRLQSGFLQCMGYPKPPCRLLTGFTNSPVRDLHPLDNSHIFLPEYRAMPGTHTSPGVNRPAQRRAKAQSARCARAFVTLSAIKKVKD